MELDIKKIPLKWKIHWISLVGCYVLQMKNLWPWKPRNRSIEDERQKNTLNILNRVPISYDTILRNLT